MVFLAGWFGREVSNFVISLTQCCYSRDHTGLDPSVRLEIFSSEPVEYSSWFFSWNFGIASQRRQTATGKPSGLQRWHARLDIGQAVLIMVLNLATIRLMQPNRGTGDSDDRNFSTFYY
jgi:hypothetical protein